MNWSDKLLRIVDKILLLRWRLIFILFFIGLALRSVVFLGNHQEGDERIYVTLVEQLESGLGYSLQGSSLLNDPIIDYAGYDKPLFFHPPGGTALNWLFFKLFGYAGFPLVQIFAYTLFFWSMMLLARSLKLSPSSIGFALTAALAAFSPIMAHVTTKFWLDGPLLAFTTFSFALYIRGVVNDRLLAVFLAGIVLGYASLIKLTAFLVIPAILVMTWPLISRPTKRVFFRFGALLIIPAILVQLPWEIFQWQIMGSPFPGWAGKPSETLIAINPYIHFVTIVNSPWVYLTMTPRIIFTLVPASLLYLLIWKQSSRKLTGMSLLIWISSIILFHVALGYIGYSKVIRYVILITPATILFFSMTMDEGIDILRNSDTGLPKYRVLATVLVIAAVAFILEIFSGIFASMSFDKVFS